VHGNIDLFQIVRALHSASSFTRRLNGRQKKGDQNSNDRNYNQKFNKGKGSYIAPPPILTFFIINLTFQKSKKHWKP